MFGGYLVSGFVAKWMFSIEMVSLCDEKRIIDEWLAHAWHFRRFPSSAPETLIWQNTEYFDGVYLIWLDP